MGDEAKATPSGTEKKHKSYKKKEHKGLKILLLIIAVLSVSGALAAYIFGVFYYTERFLPATYCDGVLIENLTAEEAADKLTMVKAPLDSTVEIIDMDGTSYPVDTSALDIKREYKGLSEALSVQDKWTFLFKKNQKKDLPAQYDIRCNDDGIEDFIAEVPVCAPGYAQQHVDSYVYEDRDGVFKVMPAFDGNEINTEVLGNAVLKAVKNRETSVSVTDAGAYITCSVREDDGDLNKEARVQNAFENASFTIDMGAETVRTLTPQELREIAGDPLDAQAFEKLFDRIQRSYSTKSGSGYRYFKSVTGEKPVVYTDYGWEMDRELTLLEVEPALSRLLADILSGKELTEEDSVTVSAVWLQEAVSHGERDTGDTFVEVDLTNQKVYLVENGELILESDCVTGTDTNDRRTPPGIFAVRFKSLDRDLVGYNPDGTESYRSHVNYWMPFNKNIGLHDAAWRGSFGGTIYKRSGSHGCVNLPLKTARELYPHVYKGMPVIVYK